MKVRFNVGDVVPTIKEKQPTKDFRLLCSVNGLFSPQDIFNLLRSGNFAFEVNDNDV